MSGNAFVAAVAGPSGAGKTTLVRKVAALLPGSTMLFFDDYAATHLWPKDFYGWIDSGCDLARFRNPDLLRDLAALRSGCAVDLPGDRGRLEPSPIIVMEQPLGRGMAGMGELIDYVVCIDLPLEVALARRLLRTLSGSEDPTAQVKEIRNFLEEYVGRIRKLYAGVQAGVLRDSDLVVDGTKEADLIAEEIARAIVGQVVRPARMER